MNYTIPVWERHFRFIEKLFSFKAENTGLIIAKYEIFAQDRSELIILNLAKASISYDEIGLIYINVCTRFKRKLYYNIAKLIY